MPDIEVKRAGRTVFREAQPAHGDGATPMVCIHGWPQSSYMWRHLLPAVAADGRRALAMDLPGFGDSPTDPPGTWDRHAEAIEEFHAALGLDRVVLAVHDTGGPIGLRWACDHPEAVAGLVISNTGFFPEHEWIEIAVAMRTEGQGEALLDSLTRDALATLLDEASDGGIDGPTVDEYWKAFATGANRRGMLELYRSFDDDSLMPYQGRLAELAVPVLLLWGEADDFLPLDYATRFAAEIPGAELVMLPGVRHFLYEDQPERCTREVVEFLRRAGL